MPPKKRVFTGLKQPKEGPNGAQFLKIIEYECDRCKAVHSPGGPHTQSAPQEIPCVAYRYGEPCEGTMVRFGWGSGRKPPTAPTQQPRVRVVRRMV